MIEKAKISGMTPLPEILMGMTDDWPPYIFLPLICLAYWTGTLRSERSTNTIAKKMTAHTSTKATSSQIASPLVLGICLIFETTA